MNGLPFGFGNEPDDDDFLSALLRGQGSPKVKRQLADDEDREIFASLPIGETKRVVSLEETLGDDDVDRYLRKLAIRQLIEERIAPSEVGPILATITNRPPTAGVQLEILRSKSRTGFAGDELDELPEPLRSLLGAGMRQRSNRGSLDPEEALKRALISRLLGGAFDDSEDENPFTSRREASGRPTRRQNYEYEVPVRLLDAMIDADEEHTCSDPNCVVKRDLKQRKIERGLISETEPQHVGLTPLQARQAVDAALSDIYHTEIEPLMEPIKDVATAYKKVKNGARWVKQNVFAPIWNGLTASAEALYVLLLSAIMSVILLALIALSAVLSFGFLPIGIAYAFGGITDWNILALFSWIGWFPLALTSWIIGIVDTRVDHEHYTDEKDKDKVRITNPASWNGNLFIYEGWLVAGIHLRMWTYHYVVDPILDIFRVVFDPRHREAAEHPIFGPRFYGRAARWLAPRMQDGDHFIAHTLPYWWSAVVDPQIRNNINHERLTFEGRRVWKFARLGRWIHRNITMPLALKSKTGENEEFWNAITAPLNYLIGFLRMRYYIGGHPFVFTDDCRDAVLTGVMHRVDVEDALATIKAALVSIWSDIREFVRVTFIERPVAADPTDSLVEQLYAETTLEDVERQYRFQGGDEVAWLMPKVLIDGIADRYDSREFLIKLGFQITGEYLHFYVVHAPTGWTREFGYPFSEFAGPNRSDLGAWVENDQDSDYLDTDEILDTMDGLVSLNEEEQIEQPSGDEIEAWLRGMEEQELPVPLELEPDLDLPDWLKETDVELQSPSSDDVPDWLKPFEDEPPADKEDKADQA